MSSSLSSFRRFRLLSLAGCLMLSGLVACTVSSGPDTDDGNNVKDGDDDDDGASSSSSSSSSSSGEPQADCTVNDLVEDSADCLTCMFDKCETPLRACFTCTDNPSGTGGECDAYLTAATPCTAFDGQDLGDCADAAKADNEASAASYSTYKECQVAKCDVVCPQN